MFGKDTEKTDKRQYNYVSFSFVTDKKKQKKLKVSALFT